LTKYRVTVLGTAESDMRRIAHWLAERSEAGARAWLAAYQSMLEALGSRAASFPLAEENGEFDLEIRQAIFKTRKGNPYRAVFTIYGDEVRVLRVLGPGQAPLSASDTSRGLS
jgi:plasmid stabilization system protein ParE